MNKDILDSLNSSDMNLINEGQRLLDAIRNEEQDPVYSQLFLYFGLSEVIASLDVNHLLDIDTKSLKTLRNKIAHPKRKRSIEELTEIKSNFDTIFKDVNNISDLISKVLIKKIVYSSDQIISAIEKYCSTSIFIRFLDNYSRLIKTKFMPIDEQNYILVRKGSFSIIEIESIKNALITKFGDNSRIFIKEIENQKFNLIRANYKLRLVRIKDKSRIIFTARDKDYDYFTLNEIK